MKLQPKSIHLLLSGLVCLLIFAGCDLAAQAPLPTFDSNAIYTQAAATLGAQLTQIASQSTPLPDSSVLEPTATGDVLFPAATETPGAIPNLPLTATPLPTATVGLPPTQIFPTSVPTGSASVCLQAKFIKDITIPDGTKLDPGKKFTKTWELQNTGSCTWSDDFSIVFADGDQMNGPDSSEIDELVSPGEKVQVSVELIAPYAPGEYRGDWKLADADGDEFGLGTGGKSPFWVEIKVGTIKSGVVMNFANAYCEADWESSSGDLPCPGVEGDADGFIIRLETPDLENQKENEPALWTNPEMEDDGWIKGTFPAIKIDAGDRFRADIGCLADFTKCNVSFELKYRVDGGKEKSLGVWKEEYDGEITRIDIDLTDLDGKKVQFILKVSANGEYKQDAAFWLMPHILRD